MQHVSITSNRQLAGVFAKIIRSALAHADGIIPYNRLLAFPMFRAFMEEAVSVVQPSQKRRAQASGALGHIGSTVIRMLRTFMNTLAKGRGLTHGLLTAAGTGIGSAIGSSIEDPAVSNFATTVLQSAASAQSIAHMLGSIAEHFSGDRIIRDFVTGILATANSGGGNDTSVDRLMDFMIAQQASAQDALAIMMRRAAMEGDLNLLRQMWNEYIYSHEMTDTNSMATLMSPVTDLLTAILPRPGAPLLRRLSGYVRAGNALAQKTGQPDETYVYEPDYPPEIEYAVPSWICFACHL